MTIGRQKHSAPPQSKRVARGRPPLAEAEHCRERILDATTAVFLEKGFERASTNEIARRAQTSKQTLYAMFPTKADLFVAVMSAHTEQIYSRHGYYIESTKSPQVALSEIGYQVLNMFSAPEFLALYRVVVTEVQNFPDLARTLWSVCLERGQNLLAEYLQSRRLGGPDYHKSAVQFCTLVLGDYVVNTMLNPDLEMSERAMRARVKEAVEDFCRLHPAPKRAGKKEKAHGGD